MASPTARELLVGVQAMPCIPSLPARHAAQQSQRRIAQKGRDQHQGRRQIECPKLQRVNQQRSDEEADEAAADVAQAIYAKLAGSAA